MTKLIRHKQTVRLGEGPGWGREYWDEESYQRHREYVEDLKKEGRYLEEVEMTMDMVECPQFDKRGPIRKGLGRATAMLLDVSGT